MDSGEETPAQPEEGADLKRTFKDSVFCDLFRDRENALAAFLELHPEETGVTVDDVEIKTVKSVLVDGVFNDLGFMIENRLIILVEAQSTWTPRICVRALVYYLETLSRWLDEYKIDLYRGPAFVLPAAEAYVLYTGGQKKVPEEVPLELFLPDGRRSFLEGPSRCCAAAARVSYPSMLSSPRWATGCARSTATPARRPR